MSPQNAILAAAAPSLIAALEAINQFETDIGTDPLQWPVKVPAAKLKLVGTLGLQLQPLIGAEVVAGESVINTTTAGWITKLQALQSQAPQAPQVAQVVQAA